MVIVYKSQILEQYIQPIFDENPFIFLSLCGKQLSLSQY